MPATGVLPLDRDVFERVVTRTMGEAKAEVNLVAFDQGREMMNDGGGQT